MLCQDCLRPSGTLPTRCTPLTVRDARARLPRPWRHPRRVHPRTHIIGTNESLAAARDLLPDSGRSITSIAKLLGVSPGTLFNHIPDLKELRAGAVPRQLEAPAK